MTEGWGLKHEQIGEPSPPGEKSLENEGGRYSRQGSRYKCPVMGSGHVERRGHGCVTELPGQLNPSVCRDWDEVQGPHRPGLLRQFLQEGQNEE